jgi:hypothetical protein
MNPNQELIENPPFPLTAVDEDILRLTDGQYTYHTWADVRTRIGKERKIFHIFFLLHKNFDEV